MPDPVDLSDPGREQFLADSIAKVPRPGGVSALTCRIAGTRYRRKGGLPMPGVPDALTARLNMRDSKKADKKPAKIIPFLPALRRKLEQERKRFFKALKSMNS